MGFDGKVAIITGGAGGIGSGIVRALADEGAKVVINDLPSPTPGQPSGADLVANEVNARGGEAIVSHARIGDWASGQELVAEAVKGFGRVDILVMCAGNFNATPVLELEQSEWDSIISVHLTGHVSCAQAAARQMREQGDGGRIITFASRAAFLGNSPAYSAAKAGVMGLTGALARDLAAAGITVNCILPSAQTQLFPGDAKSRPTSGGVPLTMDIAPDAIAPFVAYLASDAADKITGQFIYAAGGDICFYDTPLILSNRQTFLRKAGRWTVDELTATVPPLVGLT